MASTYMDATAAAAALKVLYDDQKVQQLFYQDNPFLALVPKDEDFGGSQYPVPVMTAAGQSRSATFSNAQGNQTAALLAQFQVTRVSDYAVASITNEMLEASRTDKMAFARLSEVEIDSKLQGLSNDIGSSLFRNGTGSIGQVSAAGLSTGVITLADPQTVTQFEVNMTLRATATDGGTDRGSNGYVIAVDRMAGTVTVASSGLGGAAANPASWAANDYLIVQGDANAKAKGLDAWIPASAPSATAFFGVDRSVDPVRLGGLRIDGSAKPIEEAIVDASMYASREGSIPDVFITNFVSWGALAKALGTKVQYIDLKGPGEISFKGIQVNGFKGPIKVIPDRSCPGALGYLLEMKTWKLLSLNQAPHIVGYGSSDPMGWLRISNADAIEARAAAYYNLACFRPGHNARVALSA